MILSAVAILAAIPGESFILKPGIVIAASGVKESDMAKALQCSRLVKSIRDSGLRGSGVVPGVTLGNRRVSWDRTEGNGVLV